MGLSLPPSGLHSPPLLGTAAVPGLVAPIANGFTGVVPFPNAHPTLETVYTNGLVPYPGTEAAAGPSPPILTGSRDQPQPDAVVSLQPLPMRSRPVSPQMPPGSAPHLRKQPETRACLASLQAAFSGAKVGSTSPSSSLSLFPLLQPRAHRWQRRCIQPSRGSNSMQVPVPFFPTLPRAATVLMSP